MKAIFLELPPFQRVRERYLSDAAYSGLQEFLMADPEAGDLIPGTGGLRKLRHGDPRRCKGKRGGLRVIYFWRVSAFEFWLFTVYDKDEAADLSADERKALRFLLERELRARSTE